jgi:archaellum component FlaF (FlaF/FlaG flagellin family)
MGLSVSAASAILFTTFVILFGIVFGSFDHFQDSLINSQNEQTERYERMMDTSISIIEVDDANDTVTLVNDGEAAIDLDDVDILVNGALADQTLITLTVQGHPGSKLWAPGEQMVIDFPMEIDGARLKVTVKEWASAYHT